MAKKYDKFDTVWIKVPIQFGKMSKDERKCYELGYLGSLMREPYWLEHYYRICERQRGAGRFLYERRWKGEKDGKIDPNGKTWYYLRSIVYANLPKEIKNDIEK